MQERVHILCLFRWEFEIPKVAAICSPPISAPFVGGDPTGLGGLEDGGNGFTSCLLQLYSCSKSKSHCLLRLKTCEQLLSHDQDLASSSSVSRSSAGALADESGDSKTPSLAEGAGKVPESELSSTQHPHSLCQCTRDLKPTS